MKTLTVMAAGLGWDLLEQHKTTSIAGVDFGPAPSVFPAVTCVAQASLRTNLQPSGHQMLSNGVWLEDLQKPSFWEQSAKLVKGKRIWSNRRANGATVGLFFFQQSLGEEADIVISPAPIHKHGGGMIMNCYTKPQGMSNILQKLCGTFPLWRYWGPLASPKVGRNCISYFKRMVEAHDVDEAYLYLPTLDYAAQKYGPSSNQATAAFREFCSQIANIVDFCEKQGAILKVIGDYNITAVTEAPLMPNATLRKAGLFKVRQIKQMAYPDFYASKAFAMCDHEVCLIYGEEWQKAIEILLATGDYEQSDTINNALIAKQGSYASYKWWTNPKEAPDYASHVDIHNKPGYDPTELFFFCKGAAKGTHGRKCTIAISR